MIPLVIIVLMIDIRTREPVQNEIAPRPPLWRRGVIQVAVAEDRQLKLNFVCSQHERDKSQIKTARASIFGGAQLSDQISNRFIRYRNRREIKLTTV
jgi:hypothetical protein